MANKLYVGNLSFDTTEADLRDLFSQAGTVSETILINDKMTGRSRGFGFVTMSDSAGAEAATSKFNGADLHGRNLTVNEAKDRESGGGGGGGGRNFGPDRRPAGKRY
jgi:RNA recognition motif-containing protein